MNDIVLEIQDLFLHEAERSPLLFNDLANMEKYISESYSERSLIELLQNADDAKATDFFIEEISQHIYVVANNGRKFNNDDIVSLCRSGASSKKRRGGTIGYRGIGFKSVVNYAKTVHLWSGPIHTTFSRELTKQLVPNAQQVPLIRIPHPFHGQAYEAQIKKLTARGFTTIFIFESINDSLSREMFSFSGSCLLFLRHVNNIIFRSARNTEQYQTETTYLNDNEKKINLTENNNSQEWLVLSNNFNNFNNPSSCAFLLNNGMAIDAKIGDAVVHSFLPTLDTLSMKIKVNGDFSTDPSRTRVVIDDATKIAAKACGDLLADIIIRALRTKQDKMSLVSVLKNANIDPLSKIRGEGVNDLIVNEMKKSVHKYFQQTIRKPVYLQPQGITNEDFDKMTKVLQVCGIGQKMERAVPGILHCLRSLGISELSLTEELKAMKFIDSSDTTRAQVLTECINETRFGMSEQLKKDIENAKLFRYQSGIKSVVSSKSTDLINPEFENMVLEKLTTSADYTSLTKKLGIPAKSLALNNTIREEQHHIIVDGKSMELSHRKFEFKEVIRKWRSAEKNVASILELMDENAEVQDVASQNVGYDIEVTTTDGKKRYYEVKSVNNMGDEFSITNNEYSCASEHNEEYIVAVVCQKNSSLRICFIKNPVNTLHLNRRITRWEWVCNSYQGETFDIDI